MLLQSIESSCECVCKLVCVCVCVCACAVADWIIRFSLTSLAPFQVAQHIIKMHTCSVDSFND